MLKLTVVYHSGHRPLSVIVPDMGLTRTEWAEAAYAVLLTSVAGSSTVPGAAEFDRALRSDPAALAAARPMQSGDWVMLQGRQLTLLSVSGVGQHATNVPAFSAPAPLPVPSGPMMHVDADTAPPEALAYVEDVLDRLWTGRGYGEWRCLTDMSGRTSPAAWASVWREYGPLVPLVPVELLAEPTGDERTGGPHRDPLPGRPVDAGTF